MLDHRRPRGAALVTLTACLSLALPACSDGSEPEAAPSSSEAPAVSTAPPTTSATPVPVPTTAPPTTTPPPAPLSRFENDPAVKALRVFLRQSALAINANDLDLPGLTAVSTPARVAQTKRVLSGPAGRYVPGPFPLTPVGVAVASATQRSITACVYNGWVLTRKGGTPTVKPFVGGATAKMRLVGKAWKVDTILNSKTIPCKGVAIPKPVFP